MTNKGFYQLAITDEQIAYARQLVAHSLAHHTVHNIWDKTRLQTRTEEFRFTGTLGEVVFADAYQLPRPTRSFGAIDGQDWGQDFIYTIDNQQYTFDIKTMRRKTGILYDNYVLNIPSKHLHRPDSRTDYYFHISLHESPRRGWIASMLGMVAKADILAGRTGILYPKGSSRQRGNQTTFTLLSDTYEIDFQDFQSPIITPAVEQQRGFARCTLQNTKRSDAAQLLRLIRQTITLDEAQSELILSHFHQRQFQKNDFIVQTSRIARELHFINDGLVRTFHTSAQQDKELTTYLACDGMFCTSFASFINQQPALESVQCLEKTSTLSISYDSMQYLYNHLPQWDKVGRILAEQHYICVAERVMKLHTVPAKEKYQTFLQTADPKIIQRTPQLHIASFLGIAPESLSRIRRELSNDPSIS